MKTSNYAEVRDALYHRESFVHGSCHAERHEGFTSTTSGNIYPTLYDVYSYGTRILTWTNDAPTPRVTFFDNRQYSQTTSRLQGMIRAAFPEAIGGLVARTVYER